MRLQNKIAVITGGATGIGRAIALRFANEGARVVVADINDDAGQATAAATQGIFAHRDIGQPEQARATVERCVAEYGGLDILVNCAAHLGGMHDAAAMPESEWRAVLGVTLDGVFYCSKYALAAMIERGGGSIVTIASVEGMMGGGGTCRVCHRQERAVWPDALDGDRLRHARRAGQCDQPRHHRRLPT